MFKREKIAKVGVLAGGPSSERDISLKSGLAVYNALKSTGRNAVWVEMTSEDVKKRIKEISFDIAFIALHGRFGEDGTIQKILESMSIPYTGSGVGASRLALDKIASRKVFRRFGIPVPEYKVIERDSSARIDGFSFPLVVKPQKEGSSIGLSLVNNGREFRRACAKAFEYGDKIIVERFIKGREITVGVLDKSPLPVVEIIPKRQFYDFTAKYIDKNTEYKVPASIPKNLYRRAQRLGLAAHNALGCSDFSRVDMMMDEGSNIYVLEVNSIPGLTERSLLPKAARAAGIDFSELCLRLLRLAMLNRNKKK